MHFSKQGKYFVVNKSATSAPCCHSYIKLLYLFTQIPTIKISKIFFSEDIGQNPEKSNPCWYNMLYLNLRGMAFILGLEIHLIFNFYLNTHKKIQSLKTGKKIICKYIINTESKLFLPKSFEDNNKNQMIIIENTIIEFMINHITMSCPKPWIGNK